MSSLQPIYTPGPDITIYTDSNTLEWDIADGNNPSVGRWKVNEISQMNVLELKAIFIGVRTYSLHKK